MAKRIDGENTEALRLEYLMAASYFWFRAEGNDEQLVSALYRSKAAKLKLALNNYCPTDEQVRAYAVDRFPAHKLHEGAI